MRLFPWVFIYICCISSVFCRRHTLILKSDARRGILCSQFAYGNQGSLSVEISRLSPIYLGNLIGFSFEKSTTNSLISSSKQKGEKCFLESSTDKRILSIRLEEKSAKIKDRSDQSFVIMSGKKPEVFTFADPEDEKTFKSLEPQISKFLKDYGSSVGVEPDNLAKEIVKVISSDEGLHAQVLGFMKQSDNVELAVYETLNSLVPSDIVDDDLSESGDNKNVVDGDNPDKKLRRDRRALSVDNEDLKNALKGQENGGFVGDDDSELLDPDQEAGEQAPGKLPAEPKKSDKQVEGEKALLGKLFDDSKGDDANGKPVNPDPNAQQNGAKPAAVEAGKDLLGNVAGDVQDKAKQMADANAQKVVQAAVNDKQADSLKAPESKKDMKADDIANGNAPNPPVNDASQKKEPQAGGNLAEKNSVNKEGEKKDAKSEGEAKRNPAENVAAMPKAESQNDAPQVDKPSGAKPLAEGVNQQQQRQVNPPIADTKKEAPAAVANNKSPEVGKANVQEVPKPPSKPRVSDATLNIIKEATKSFLQDHQGETLRYNFANGLASLNFSIKFTSSSDVGAYDLVFHNCLKGPVDISIKMVETNGNNYLSLGEQPLAMLFCVFSLIYVGLSIVWGLHLKFSKAPVFRMHYLMLAMVIVKAISLMFHSINYYVIGRHGVQEEGWAVMYYIAHMTRGFLLIVTILMIGAGWTFIKHVFTRQEKQVFAVVIPLQVFANIATIVINETEQGATRFALWNEIFTVVDLLCCAGVLFPVIWSIRHLRQAAQSDGKVAQNLRKLRLFRHFYILIICYIYFTRIIVYLLRMTTPFTWSWLVELFEQSVTLIFFVSVGCKFRPFNDNPYLQLPATDDSEDVVMQRFDVEQAWSQSGLADGVTRVHMPQGLNAARENRRNRDDAPNRPLPSEAEAGDSDLLPLIRP